MTGRRTVALVALAASAAATVALVAAAAVGGAASSPALADPGALSRWGLLGARTAYDLTAMGTLGVLVVAVLLLPGDGDRLSEHAQRLVRLSGKWAAGWAAAAAASVLLVVSDAVGTPVWNVLAPDMLPLALDLPQTRALLSSAWLAALVAIWAGWTRSPAGGRLLLLTAAGAVLPPLLTGHAGHGEGRTLAVTALSVHVLAAAGWVGGLAALALHLRRSSGALAQALPRYSVLALVLCVAVGLSGAVTGWATLSGFDELWSSSYGRLVLAKLAALLALGSVGYLHRRRTIAAVVRRQPRAFLVLAAVEIVLMAGTVALAVGLSRTVPPDADTHAIGTVSSEVLVSGEADV